jgi:hypothetical protein
VSGYVELRSGRWKWQAAVADESDGPVDLLFQRDDVPNGTMHAAARRATDEDEVYRRALDPDERTWMDRQGRIWVLEPDRGGTESDVPGRRTGRLRCRNHTPRTPQPVSWPALFSLGALRDEEVATIVRIAEIERLTRGLHRVGDRLPRHPTLIRLGAKDAR